MLLPMILAAAAAAAPPGIVDARLPNGLEVTIVPDAALPVVATQTWFRVGAANERSGERGLAHLFEHLMFGATTHRGEGEYSAWHHRFGGYENAFTSPDETVYVSEIPPEGLDGVLEMEADRMRDLVVDRAALDNEIRIVLEELRLRTENDPVSRALVAAQRKLLGDHPYAYDPSGNKDDVAGATVDEARRFYDDYYRPDLAHLVIVGPVDADRTLEEVRRLYGGLEPGAVVPPDVPRLDAWAYPRDVDLREDIPPVEVAVVGVPLPPPDAPDAAAIDVMLQLLSGGAVDRFREEIVVRSGKAVAAGTQSIRLRRGGALAFYAAALPYRRKGSAYRFVDEARARVARLDWLTDDSLAAAKRALRGERLRRVYFADERADAIGRARFWEGSVDRAFDEAARIDAVTREEVAAAVRKYVAAADPIRLYVRPEHVPIWVRLFGWLYPVIR